MPRYTIDRFEGDAWAVLEDEDARTFNVPRRWLPPDAREGDVLDVSQQAAAEGSAIQFVVDVPARNERLDQAARRRSQLPRGPGGDLAL
jgi:hypothetical protein